METSNEVEALRRALQASLATQHAEWRVDELSVAGSGLEGVVFRARSPVLGDIALRVPWRRWISNDNDPALDARALLQKEQLLANHMAEHGVPAPRAIARHSGDDDFDYLVSAFVDNDRSPVDRRAFGRLVRQIHEVPPIAAPFACQAGAPLEAVIAERLVQRVAVIERLAAVRLALPPLDELRARLTSDDPRRSILHMDARQANLLTWRGHVRAIVDWSNALLGEPALELARIAEYGGWDPAFQAGYAEQGPVAPAPPERELLYRLDSAVMLAVVFLSEAPDPHRAPTQVARVQELLATLARPLRPRP